MKKAMYHTNQKFLLLILFFVIEILVFITACSKDANLLEIDEEPIELTELEENTEESVEEIQASTRNDVPTVGKTYVIKNVKNGRTLDIAGASNNNGANLQVWGTDVNTTATHRQWEILSTGGSYVRLKGVDSGKSLRVKSTINGSNANQYAYRGWSSQKFTFHEVGNNNNNNNNNNGGGDDAADIIGSGWKLNGYTGNLNVGSNNNGLSYADNASTSESHFFFEKDGYAAFRCYPGNPTSGGSSNPRTELREIINGGDNYWNGNTNTEHSMKWRFKIEDLTVSSDN